MKTLIVFLLLSIAGLSYATDVYIVEYEGYTWNPCSGNMCLAIYCTGPGGNCTVPAVEYYCQSLAQLEKIIKKNGTEHIRGLWRLTWNGNEKGGKVKKLKIVPTVKIELESEDIVMRFDVGDEGLLYDRGE